MSDNVPNSADDQAETDPTAGRVVARTGAAAGTGGSLKVRLSGTAAHSTDDEDYVFPPGWVTAYVKTASKVGARVFVIEPDPAGDERIEYAGRYVRGAFRIVRKIGGTRAAQEVWDAAKEEDPPSAP